MAVLIRVLLEGLVVELARAQGPAAVEQVDQAYQDMRGLFARFVLAGRPGPPVDIGALVGEPERAEHLATTYARRMRRVSAGTSARVRGMYLGPVSNVLYGGARGTSYFDVLDAAGIDDVATVAVYVGLPAYSPEEVLTLAPPWIVAPASGVEAICDHAALRELEACREGRVIGIDDDVIGDPGLAMLDAAEAVFEAVHGRR